MKPHEFWDSTYRDVKLYVESRSSQIEFELKSQIKLADELGDKLNNFSMICKKPKNISLIEDVYKELFEKELIKAGRLKAKARSEDDLKQFMFELGEELKNGMDNENK